MAGRSHPIDTRPLWRSFPSLLLKAAIAPSIAVFIRACPCFRVLGVNWTSPWAWLIGGTKARLPGTNNPSRL